MRVNRAKQDRRIAMSAAALDFVNAWREIVNRHALTTTEEILVLTQQITRTSEYVFGEENHGGRG